MNVKTFVANMKHALRTYESEVKSNPHMGKDHKAEWLEWCEWFCDIYLDDFKPLDDPE